MKRSILTSVIMASCAVHAGTMGSSIHTVDKTLQGFVSAEGGYSWARYNYAGLRGLKAESTSGRIAGGAMYSLSNLLSLSGELGLGYFERPKFGFGDVLGGLVFTQPKYDLFFKAGAFIYKDDWMIGSDRVRGFYLLPEIKIGGSYHLNEHFSVFTAWTSTFGGKSKAVNHKYLDVITPAINTISTGLSYRF